MTKTTSNVPTSKKAASKPANTSAKQPTTAARKPVTNSEIYDFMMNGKSQNESQHALLYEQGEGTQALIAKTNTNVTNLSKSGQRWFDDIIAAIKKMYGAPSLLSKLVIAFITVLVGLIALIWSFKVGASFYDTARVVVGASAVALGVGVVVKSFFMAK